MHFVTAVRLNEGSSEDRIAGILWLNGLDGVSGSSTVESIVEWLDAGNTLLVATPDGPVGVVVVRPQGHRAYLRTVANNTWTDNLLQLPRY